MRRKISTKHIIWALVFLGIFIIALGSLYLFSNTWQSKQQIAKVYKTLDRLKAISALQNALNSEINCKIVLLHSEKKAAVCSKLEKTTDAITQKTFGDVPSLLKTTRDYLLDLRIFEEKYDIGVVRRLAEEGERSLLRKHFYALVQNLSDKAEALRIDRDRLNAIEALERRIEAVSLEKTLIAYFLQTRQAIPDRELLLWSRLSSVASDTNGMSATIVKKLAPLSKRLDAMRIEVLNAAKSARYPLAAKAWQQTETEYEKLLFSEEASMIERLLSQYEKILTSLNKEVYFFAFVALFSLVLLILLILERRRSGKEEAQKRYFFETVRKLYSYEKFKRTDRLDFDAVVHYVKKLNQVYYDAKGVVKTSRFTFSRMLHEINSPLDALRGYDALLKETGLNNEQRHYLKAIEEKVKHLQHIVSHMKQFETKPEQYQLAVSKPESVDLFIEIERIVEAFTNAASRKDVELALFTDPELPRKVILEKGYLSEAISNLLHHALYRTEPYHPIDINIYGIGKGDDEHTLVRFEIDFDGKKYSSEELEKIESALQQGDQSCDQCINDPSFVRCFVVVEFLSRMNTKLHVENKESKGAKIYFDLALEATDASWAKLKGDPVKGGQLEIAVALPSENVRYQKIENLRRYVESLGASFVIYTYESLQNKREWEKKPDLMFVYHHYLRLEGEINKFETLQIPIVLITTPALRSRIEKGKKLFDFLIYEPVSYLKVRHILQSFIQKYRNENEVVRTVSERERKPRQYPNLRVMIAEDNAINATLFKERFERFGTSVTVVKEAMDIERGLKKHEYQLLLIDKDMLKEKEGADILNRIRYKEKTQSKPPMPIVLIARKDDDKSHYISLGFNAVIEKSVSDEEIEALLKRDATRYDLHLVSKEADGSTDEMGNLDTLNEILGDEDLLL